MDDDLATDLATAQATAAGWAMALAGLPVPTEEHVAAAQAALDALAGRADTSASAMHLRSVLANARVRITASQLAGLRLPEAPPAPSADYDAEQSDPQEPWEEWTGPRPARLDEGPGDIADRVAADLAGAAELVTQLGADRPVRPDLVDQSSFLLARVLASGADTIRLLAVQRPTVAEPTPELVQRVRDDLEERVASAESDATDAVDRAVAAENRVTVLGEELNKAHRELERTQDQLAKSRASGAAGWRTWGEDVVKALGFWAPGYADGDPDSFRAQVLEIARSAKADVDREQAAMQSLRAELRQMVGPIDVGQNGSAPLLVRLQELVSAGKATEAAGLGQDSVQELRGQLAELQDELTKERELTARQRAQLGVRKFAPSNGAERGAAWTGP